MPIQFLWGDEDYLIEAALKKLKKEILKDDINPLNYRVVDNPSFSLFSETLRTNPMMFGEIMVVIKCPKYFLETKTKEKLDDKQTNELISALNNIPQSIHIILICPTPRGEKKKPDSRKKLFKEIQKLTKPQEFQSFRSYEEYKIIPVLKSMASDIGLKINQEEASYLIQTAGANLRDLSNQLEKIKLYIHPNTLVTKDSIKNNATVNVDIFNLSDYIIQKDWARALNLISDILQKEHYLPSLAFIQTVFSNLVKTKIFSNKFSSYDLAIKLNQNEFVVKKNIEKLRTVKLDDLIRLKINLEQAEYELKSGAIKDALCALEKAFLDGGSRNA